MNSYTLFFEDIGAADLPKVGGKGANLGELSRAGFNVPLGFCVTTDAFTHFMAEANEDIYKQLEDLNANDLAKLRQTGEDIRAYLADLPLPSEVEAAVLEAWRELGDAYAYAVRSSATAEDLPHASFAGQQDTYLNVRGKDYLLRRVKDCFISLFTDRAILYRVQNGFDHREVLLSVVVQRMVQPEVAGIMFTADPITGDRNTVSIDASFGLGEALVSGLVSADLYKVDKLKGKLIKKQIANKQMAIRSLPGGGVQQMDLADNERKQQALGDRDVIALAQLGAAIEAHYGSPQDIEWALADNTLYITQSRPITSLFPVPEPRPTDGALHTYFSLSHFQVMTDAMPPLSLSTLRTIVPFRSVHSGLEADLIQTAAGRMYVDLSPLLRNPVGKRLILKGLKNADQLAAGALAKLAEREDFKAEDFKTKSASFNPLSKFPILRPYFFKMLRMLWRGTPEGITEQTTALMNEHLTGISAKLEAAATLQEKLSVAVTEMQGILKPVFSWAPYLVAGAIASAGLKVVLGKKVDKDVIAATGRGLTGNVATEMDLAVGDLADAARASNQLKSYLLQNDLNTAESLSGASLREGGKVFVEKWNAFIATYGARGPSEIDLSRPRWYEDSRSLQKMVMNATAHREAGAHRVHYQTLIDEGKEASETILKAAHSGLLGPLRGPLARRFLRVSRNLTPLREHHKFLAIQALALIKPIFVEAGEQLAGEGRLEAADDIWFLSIPEILKAFDKPDLTLEERVAERQTSFEHHKNLSAPRVITSEGEIPPLKLDINAPPGALVGSPVSAGVIEGVAKVILDPAQDALHPGEILVAPFTDPGWTPLFVNAAGLITEVGGLMTHGSVVAREYGIPAVVGVVNATGQIKTGQRLRVHGDAGYIELLDDETSSENPVPPDSGIAAGAVSL